MNPDSKSATAVKDPVCGMNVEPAAAKHRAEHEGTTYYFCCAGCRQKFTAEPGKYLHAQRAGSGLTTISPAAVPAASAPAFVNLTSIVPATQGPVDGHAAHPEQASGGSYVCPMCSEVRETKPGPCPKCGMALEPETPLPTTSM